MPLLDKRRNAVRNALRNMDMAPWHRCYGLLVWRNGLQEWKFSGPTGGEIFGRAAGLENAVDLVMTNGFEVHEPSGWFPGMKPRR